MNLIGQKFGRLTPIEKIQIKYCTKWRCKCECGNEVTIIQGDLRRGHTKSCGCLSNENRIKVGLNNLIHGNARKHNRSKEFTAWISMKQRCYDPNYHNFERYGGRGIKVCQRWLDSFENFLNDVGKAPEDEYTLDRINNDGNYEPKNVRWATWEEQNNNQSTSKRLFK